MPEKIDSGAIVQAGFNTPFAEQIDFFRQKLNLPTEHWDDIMRSAHDRAFVVAGAMKADLLADLHEAVGKVIGEGKSIGWFRKEFAAIVGKHGWQGWTGEGSPEGFAWRTKVIYQTNLATSYAAGRYAQLTDPELLTLRPWWRYKHADGVASPRLQHVAWNGLTLPHDHPFWQTHFPPNGWNCFPAGVSVRCDARIGLKTWYAGKLVEIETAAGNRLSVTANHPVLTSRGWLAAQMVEQGDQLLRAAGDIDAPLAKIVDNQDPPASAEDLFETLAAQGLRVVPMAPDDFHGDAGLRKPEIHVSGSDSALMDVVESAPHQLVGERGLDGGLHRHVEPAGISVGAALAAALLGDPVLAQDAANGRLGNVEASGDLRLADQPGTVQRNNLALGVIVERVSSRPGGAHDGLGFSPLADANPPAAHTGAAVADGNSVDPQNAPERIAAGAQFFGELLEANAFLVAADEVVGICEFDWAGHVYDFSTRTALIVAGGLVVSNCHCRVVAVNAREYAKAQAAGLTEPPEGWESGAGIAKGFDYAPGASLGDELRTLVESKAARLPDPLARDFAADVAPTLDGRPPTDPLITRLAREIADAPAERLVVLDRHGNTLADLAGNEDMVRLPAATLPLLPDAIAIHNHPGVPQSFSVDDVKLAVWHRLQETHVVDRLYHYTIARPAGAEWGPDFWRQTLAPVVARIESDVTRRFDEALAAGMIDREQYAALLAHAIWEEVSAEVNIGYLRIHRKDHGR